MTKDEALKLALEALEEIADEVFSPYDNKLGGAILAIREALAQPEQEPVATVTSESANPNISMSWWHEPALPVGTKLYASLPANKPLTNEEMQSVIETALGLPKNYMPLDNSMKLGRAIEQAHGIKE